MIELGVAAEVAPTLRNLIRSSIAVAREPRCDICAASLDTEHAHAVDLELQRLCCACSPCAMAFSGVTSGRFRTVPTTVRREPSSTITDAQCSALGIPVRLFFLFFQSRTGRFTAFFPGPAGAAEAEISQDACRQLAHELPLVESLQPDIEALLVRGRPGSSPEIFAVPIDVCYRLTAIVRKQYHGFDGGSTVHTALDEFFTRLRTRAR